MNLMTREAHKVNAFSNDPLASGRIVHDHSTKRLLERKKRELESMKQVEEKAKLEQKMALLKKEAAKRKKKKAKEEDEMASILGMPKPSEERKKKKKEAGFGDPAQEEKDFDFVNRDMEDMTSLLDKNRDDGGTGSDALKDRNADDSLNREDAELIIQ